MSEGEFNHLVDSCLERTATAAEVARLRELTVASPELMRRLKQREKLHRAQIKCLAEFKREDGKWIRSWLLNYAQRFNRTASYICLLMVVLVQTRVTLDTDYKGLNLYVINSISGQDSVEVDEGDESERTFEVSSNETAVPDIGLSESADEDDEG
jgi:hypothetical protein